MELRPQQAAELLGVSRKEFYTLVHEGKIKPTSYTKGGHMRFDGGDVALQYKIAVYEDGLRRDLQRENRVAAAKQLATAWNAHVEKRITGAAKYLETQLPWYKRLYKKTLRSIGIIK